MIKRTLNVSVIQMPVLDTAQALEYLDRALQTLCASYIRPELVVGAEFGISSRPQPIPGPVTDYMGALAKKYGVYFIPCTMAERAEDLGEGQYYNACPVYAPDGRMLAVYRKMVPFWPAERSSPGPTDGYCLFEIPEKNLKVGLMICYDQYFPEIARTLTLMGAELLLCPALEPAEFNYVSGLIPRVRAMENEAYFVWTCSAGVGPRITFSGNSIIAGPSGEVIYQAGEAPTVFTKTLDLDEVRRKRISGEDQHLNSLRRFSVDYPFAGRLDRAPVFRDLLPLTEDRAQYRRRLEELGEAPLPEPPGQVDGEARLAGLRGLAQDACRSGI